MLSKLPQKRRPCKPTKPQKDYPLTVNGNGQWSKKIRGKVFYFGPWSDPEGALRRYLDVKDDLLAGRKPRTRDGFTLRDLANSFLTAKKRQLESGEITPRTFQDYHRVCERILETVGKSRLVEDMDQEDFGRLRDKFAETMGTVALGNEIARVRVVFNFGFNNGHVDRPVRFGAIFKRPSKRVLRRERQKAGPRMFEAEEVRKILESSDGQLRAMILLGSNCGFGNHDCATLPLSALDLEGRWINFPRPKTGIDRHCPLWPETVAAIREAVKRRPHPRNIADLGLVFLTKYGQPWVRTKRSRKLAPGQTEGKIVALDGIAHEFSKLLTALNMKRDGISFYALRHTFETIAGESKDQVAVDAIMGHVRDDMASVYRERISDARLLAVTTFVHDLVFNAKDEQPEGQPRN